MSSDDIDPSQHDAEPCRRRVSESNAMATHPVEPEPLRPTTSPGAPNPSQLPVEPEFGPMLPRCRARRPRREATHHLRRACMTRVTAPGPVPPELGQEKEEPEQAMEDDIPTDDRGEPGDDATRQRACARRSAGAARTLKMSSRTPAPTPPPTEATEAGESGTAAGTDRSGEGARADAPSRASRNTRSSRSARRVGRRRRAAPARPRPGRPPASPWPAPSRRRTAGPCACRRGAARASASRPPSTTSTPHSAGTSSGAAMQRPARVAAQHVPALAQVQVGRALGVVAQVAQQVGAAHLHLVHDRLDVALHRGVADGEDVGPGDAPAQRRAASAGWAPGRAGARPRQAMRPARPISCATRSTSASCAESAARLAGERRRQQPHAGVGDAQRSRGRTARARARAGRRPAARSRAGPGRASRRSGRSRAGAARAPCRRRSAAATRAGRAEGLMRAARKGGSVARRRAAVGTVPRTVWRLPDRAAAAAAHNRRMVEKATYGITALRYAGAQIVEAMMGLIDSTQARWDLRPAPTRLTEVVDRLVEGDTVISLFPDERGRAAARPRGEGRRAARGHRDAGPGARGAGADAARPATF